MGTGLKFRTLGGILVLSAAVLCTTAVSAVDKAPARGQKKTKKLPPAPLPSGPTGPVQQIPLDSIAAVPPQVSYQDNQLTIVAPNSTLADILRAVRKLTGAEIDVPSAPERVVTHLGPGPARDVVAELLNGSRFNYVLLGSPGNEKLLTRVVLVAKSGGASSVLAGESGTPAPVQPEGQPGIAQASAPPDPDAPEAGDPEPADENADDNADQQAQQEAEQPPANPDQQGNVKTPQQMLQEMQQRQMQLQQQQPPGQPPVPGAGLPPRPQQQ